MQAYENPAFVEDMVRNAALILREDARVAWFRVHAENQENYRLRVDQLLLAGGKGEGRALPVRV